MHRGLIDVECRTQGTPEEALQQLCENAYRVLPIARGIQFAPSHGAPSRSRFRAPRSAPHRQAPAVISHSNWSQNLLG